jgi:hypothetical protein
MLFVYALAFAAQVPAAPVEQLLSQAGKVQLVYPLNRKIEVTPGQEFYGQFQEVSNNSVAYRLAQPFKSSMGGSMGLPFAFSIDETELLPSRTRDGWTYYVPKHKQFRAWHGLLGNVLAEGDTVGLRVNQDGPQEWFVDNSIHNGMRTIWSRKLKPKDPAVTEVEVTSRSPVGPVHKLIYLGVSSGQVRVRHEQVFPDDSITRDDFEFPVTPDGTALGAVMGATFRIEPKPVGATIEVLTGMTGDSGSIKPEDRTSK